jgi:inorganic pyrophosphatase
MTHPWHDVSPGEHLPGDFTAVIEIPMGSNVKYELDKKSGLLRLDRVLYSAVYYPANYGFIPRTLAEDDDPLDVLVMCQGNLAPLTLVEVRSLRDYHELPDHRITMLRRFFLDYKVLENQAVEVGQFEAASAALGVIEAAVARYKSWQHPPTSR